MLIKGINHLKEWDMNYMNIFTKIKEIDNFTEIEKNIFRLYFKLSPRCFKI